MQALQKTDRGVHIWIQITASKNFAYSGVRCNRSISFISLDLSLNSYSRIIPTRGGNVRLEYNTTSDNSFVATQNRQKTNLAGSIAAKNVLISWL
jgi:hypothetical protein